MLVTQQPHTALRGCARAYYGFHEVAAGPVRRQEGPGTDIVLVFSLDNGWLIDGERRTSFVGGLHDRQVVTEHPGESHGIQVNLPPYAAFSLFGVPMDALRSRTVELDDLLGAQARRLVERLAAAPSWPNRFALLDTAFARRFADAPRPTDGVVWAYERLRETHGRTRVGELARELGWSRRRLAARFGEQIGAPPKTIARLLRFERAVELAADGRLGWAAVAAECGYYDQSHLVHEFRAITGRTPTDFARTGDEGVTFFQDGAPPTA